MKILGKDLEYWIELDIKAKELDVEDLIVDNARLRAKLAYYEKYLVTTPKVMNDLISKSYDDDS